MKLIISKDALEDLERLRNFLSAVSPASARNAAEALIKAMESLQKFPKRGAVSRVEGLRESVIPFGASAYVVRYAVFEHSDEIVIVRIWHGRENRL